MNKKFSASQREKETLKNAHPLFRGESIPFVSDADSPPIPPIRLLDLVYSKAPEETPVAYSYGLQKKYAQGYGGSRMIWPTRGSGNVTISNVVPFWDGIQARHESFYCTLALPKAALIEYLEKIEQIPFESTRQQEQWSRRIEWPVWCTLALWEAVLLGAPARNGQVSLTVGPTGQGRLRLSLTDLQALTRAAFRGYSPPRPQEEADEFEQTLLTYLPPLWEKFHALDPAPPWLRLWDLMLYLFFYLLSTRDLNVVLSAPRGPRAASSRMNSRIQVVLFIYYRLARLRERNVEVQTPFDALLECVRYDPQIQAYLERYSDHRAYLKRDSDHQAYAIALTHWWFRGQWEEWGQPGLLGAAPREMLQRYLQKKSGPNTDKNFAQAMGVAQDIDPTIVPEMLRGWIDQYLLLQGRNF